MWTRLKAGQTTEHLDVFFICFPPIYIKTSQNLQQGENREKAAKRHILTNEQAAQHPFAGWNKQETNIFFQVKQTDFLVNLVLLVGMTHSAYLCYNTVPSILLHHSHFRSKVFHHPTMPKVINSISYFLVCLFKREKRWPGITQGWNSPRFTINLFRRKLISPKLC